MATTELLPQTEQQRIGKNEQATATARMAHPARATRADVKGIGTEFISPPTAWALCYLVFVPAAGRVLTSPPSEGERSARRAG